MMSALSDAQAAERREAGAEIVERQRTAEVVERGDEARRLVEVADHGGLGDLDDQAARQVRPAGDGRGDQRQPLRIAHRLGRDIDRNARLGRRLQRLQRARQHVVVDQPDEAEALAQLDEILGHGDRPVRPFEAQQAFVEDHRARGDIDHRLEGQLEPLVVQRRHQFARQRRVAALARLARRRGRDRRRNGRSRACAPGAAPPAPAPSPRARCARGGAG